MCGFDQISCDRLPNNLARKFRSVLDHAKTEKPLQLLFEQHPIILLTSIVCHRTSWIFPRKSLPKPGGGSWVPDFMICDWTSVGPLWTIVELESPTARATNTKGIPEYADTLSSNLRITAITYGNMLRFCATTDSWGFTESVAHGSSSVGQRSEASPLANGWLICGSTTSK
jgi:hypothetical protein